MLLGPIEKKGTVQSLLALIQPKNNNNIKIDNFRVISYISHIEAGDFIDNPCCVTTAVFANSVVSQSMYTIF